MSAGRDLFKELINGDDICMGVMTPKMVFEADMTALLRSDAFIDSVRWVSIDEAQLVRQEGVFQAGYKSLLFLHVLLKHFTMYVLATAIALPVAALSMVKSLGLHPGQYTNASIDHPNLKYIPRFFQHPTTTRQFLDTSFIVPIDMQKPANIIQTLVFRDVIYSRDEMEEFLNTLVPVHIPGREGLIKTYCSKLPWPLPRPRIWIMGITGCQNWWDVGWHVPSMDVPKGRTTVPRMVGKGGMGGIGERGA
ncbi:hypothetical protein B0H10DRAFT_1966046 [Mycena sp. CBHHK59/15]|nr:hypothetical protein B0H10DRAFT_1966046 [Mycena sp. CBHHK59/15]